MSSRLPWLTLVSACILCLVPMASSGIAPPNASAASAERAYEMVTPADKIARRGAQSSQWRDFDANGLPSPDGSRVFLYSSYYSMMSGGFPMPISDFIVLERDPVTGWGGRSIVTARPHSAVTTGNLNVSDFDANFDNFIVRSTWPLVTAANPLGELGWVSRIYTRYGDERGFKEWLWDPSQVPSGVSEGGARASVQFTGDGKQIIRSGQARGLLGPEDPSLQQLAGNAGGDTIYRQDYESEQLSLVNECTGEGAGATTVPERAADGKLTFRRCEAGTIVDRRGAHVGGGGGASNTAVSGPRDPSVNADGSRIYFSSPADNATACTAGTLENTACPTQLYLRQTAPDGEEVVRWISKPEIENQDIGLLGRGTLFEGASKDGRVVFFTTNAVLTADDPNGGDSVPVGGITTGTASLTSWDLFKYELPHSSSADPDEGQLTRLTGGPTGQADPDVKCTTGRVGRCLGLNGSAVRYFSDDGGRVYFTTASPIEGAVNSPPQDANEENLPRGGEGSPYANYENRNIYLYDSNKIGRQRWKFIASVPLSDATTTSDGCASFFYGAGGVYTPAGPSNRPVPTNTSANCFRGTADGRMVVFQTSGKLTADDDDEATDVYAYDADADRLFRLTASPVDVDPYPCSWASGINPAQTGACNGQIGGRLMKESEEVMRHNNITEDGEIFFESRLPLLPEEDTNGDHMDVYRWKDGQLSLISPGKADHDAFFGSNTTDGESVFFSTTEALDPYRELESSDADIYVARRGGGFPPPERPIPCSLADDHCHQGASSKPPDIAGQVATQAVRATSSASADPEPHRRVCPKTGARERKLRARNRRLRAAAKRRSGRSARSARRRAKATARRANHLRTTRKRCQRRNGGKTR